MGPERCPAPLETRPAPTALLVSANEESCASLERIFTPDWTVVRSATVASALRVSQETTIPIVLCDTNLMGGTWRELLEQISLLPDPPLLIVTSRLVDDYLWAEALNLGAWDVLAQPFETEEVIRIIGLALHHWQDRHGD